MRLLFLIVLVYAFSQIAGRLRKNGANTKGIKTEFQSAIADAKNRLPSTGLFQLLKGEASNSKIIEETIEELVEVVDRESTLPIDEAGKVPTKKEPICEIKPPVMGSIVDQSKIESPLTVSPVVEETSSIDDPVIKAAFEARSTNSLKDKDTDSSEDVSCLIDDDKVALNECKEEYPIETVEGSIDSKDKTNPDPAVKKEEA